MKRLVVLAVLAAACSDVVLPQGAADVEAGTPPLDPGERVGVAVRGLGTAANLVAAPPVLGPVAVGDTVVGEVQRVGEGRRIGRLHGAASSPGERVVGDGATWCEATATPPTPPTQMRARRAAGAGRRRADG